jgi:hypothetical protein
MRVNVKYTVEFSIKSGRVQTGRVIGEDVATPDQKAAIVAIKPLVTRFIKSKIKDAMIDVSDCVVLVHVRYSETPHGVEMSFKL